MWKDRRAVVVGVGVVVVVVIFAGFVMMSLLED